jgi:gliding motility-associated peptidyl-prolyl isomerase
MRYVFTVLVVLFFVACDGPEPRRPVKVKSGSFMKESAARNKALLAEEQKLIKNLIAKDTGHTYHSTSSGSWYYYDIKNDSAAYFPQTDDIVRLTYSISSLQGDTIYAAAEIDTLLYVVDKQELFPGLRNSIKLLKEKETATFFFPSSLAFGYPGDRKKIGPNIPIKSTISLLDIKKSKDSI